MIKSKKAQCYNDDNIDEIQQRRTKGMKRKKIV